MRAGKTWGVAKPLRGNCARLELCSRANSADIEAGRLVMNHDVRLQVLSLNRYPLRALRQEPINRSLKKLRAKFRIRYNLSRDSNLVNVQRWSAVLPLDGLAPWLP